MMTVDQRPIRVCGQRTYDPRFFHFCDLCFMARALPFLRQYRRDPTRSITAIPFEHLLDRRHLDEVALSIANSERVVAAVVSHQSRSPVSVSFGVRWPASLVP